MRIWIGKDVEHNPSYGKMTLFVESSNPDIDIVLDVFNSIHDQVEAVYFGAGEVDIENWTFLPMLHKFPSEVILGLEMSKPVSRFICVNFDFVIYRLPLLYVPNNLYIKYRSTQVGIVSINEFKSNDILDLKNGQYSCDVELYNGDIK